MKKIIGKIKGRTSRRMGKKQILKNKVTLSHVLIQNKATKNSQTKSKNPIKPIDWKRNFALAKLILKHKLPLKTSIASSMMVVLFGFLAITRNIYPEFSNNAGKLFEPIDRQGMLVKMLAYEKGGWQDFTNFYGQQLKILAAVQINALKEQENTPAQIYAFVTHGMEKQTSDLVNAVAELKTTQNNLYGITPSLSPSIEPAQGKVLGINTKNKTPLKATPVTIPPSLKTQIETVLNQYLAAGKFVGAQGPQGLPGTTGLINNSTTGNTGLLSNVPFISYAQPSSVNNFGGASLAGFTNLSASTFTTGLLNASGPTTLNNLTVTGGTTLSTTTINGTITATKFIGDGSLLTGITGGSSQWTTASATAIYYNSGNVGIGTATPAQKLHIVSDGGSNGVTLEIQDTNVTNAGVGFLQVYQGNTVLQSFTSGKDVAIWDSAGQRMTIKSGGNVGIGTTTPQSLLEIAGSSPVLRITSNPTGSAGSITTGVSGDAYSQYTIQGGQNWRVGNKASSGYFTIANGTDLATNPRLTIDNSGNVGIGTTTPPNTFTLGSGGISIYNTGNSMSGNTGSITFYNTGNGTSANIGQANGNLATQNNFVISKNLPTLTFQSNAFVSTYGSLGVDASANIVLTQSSSTQAIVLNGGNVGIGTSTPSAPLEVKGSGTGGTIAKFTDNNTTGCTLATGGTISCSSDARLKKNISDITYGLSTIMDLRPVEYNWKYEDDAVTKNLGFIAQEVQNVVPKLVSQNESGQYQLNTTGIVPILTKAVQEQQTAIVNLQNTITNLQNSGHDFASSTTINVQLYLSKDSVGEAKVLKGSDSVRISFTHPYRYQPIVTITSIDNYVPAFVTLVDASGFTIKIDGNDTKHMYQDIMFNWHAFAGVDSVLTVSDGSSQPIELAQPSPVVSTNNSAASADSPPAENPSPTPTPTDANPAPSVTPTPIPTDTPATN